MHPRPTPGFAVTAAILLISLAVTGTARAALRSHQADQAARVKLARGVWNFHGVDREFKLDGIWFSDGDNPNTGHWHIKNGVLTIVADRIGWTISFPLPLNPNGTPGMD